LPHLSEVLVEDMVLEGNLVRIVARTDDDIPVPCPGCRSPSVRRHSRYGRLVADNGIGGHQVVVALSVRRLFCDNAGCARSTFAEQVPKLTVRYGRRTPALRRVLEAVGVVLAGLPGARLSSALSAPVSRTTMLSLVMALPDPESKTPRVLGVDDFAMKKGHCYGSVIVDCESHAPIDLLPDRDAETFAAWLTEHPGIEIICRDRATAFATAARTAAPEALQVADRFHLWKNLCEAVEKDISVHRSCLAGAALKPESTDPGTGAAADPDMAAVSPEGRRETRRRERHAAVHALYDKGVGIYTIVRELKLDPKTVKKYALAARVEDVPVKDAHLDTAIRPYLPYLHERWNEGCTQAKQLHAELRERGYLGSARTVRRHLQPLRTAGRTAPLVPDTPTARQTTNLLTRHPDTLDTEQTLTRKRVLGCCPEMAEAAVHIEDFATMLTRLEGRRLPAWIESVQTSELSALRGFARNLRNDLEAVIRGLSVSWNSGVVEGRVTDIKSIKRQMGGRAGLPLLRKRVLLVAASRRPRRVTSAPTT
jgi:transposase